MIAVIFEVVPVLGRRTAYLAMAEILRQQLEKVPGFLTIERFESMTLPGKILSLSFWESEDAVKQWRQNADHRAAQIKGRDTIFADYRLRVAYVLRDYGLSERDQAPSDLVLHE